MGCIQRFDLFDIKSTFSRTGRKYDVIMTAVNDTALRGPEQMYADPKCPKIGSYYNYNGESNPLALLGNIQFDRRGEVKDYNVWKVTLSYDSDFQDDGNPYLQKPVYTWARNKYEKPAIVDIYNTPILNSAYMSFDPPIMKDDGRPIFGVERNEPNYSAINMQQYQDAVNSSPWQGGDVATWKCSVSASQERWQGIYYWKVKYEFEFHHETWIAQPLDQGRYKFLPNSLDKTSHTQWSIIKDVNGAPVTDPVPLNGSGDKLTGGANPVFLQFETYQYADFNRLGLV